MCTLLLAICISNCSAPGCGALYFRPLDPVPDDPASACRRLQDQHHWWKRCRTKQKAVSINSNTSARTSLINCSALLICSGVPESSTGLVCAPGSASLSLVTCIFAPDWSWRHLIVSPAFPMITPTYSKSTTVRISTTTNITLQVTISKTTLDSVIENKLNTVYPSTWDFNLFACTPLVSTIWGVLRCAALRR